MASRGLSKLYMLTCGPILYLKVTDQISAIKTEIQLFSCGLNPCFITDKSCIGQALEVNKIEEQFENIRLTRDPSETLRMQDMLGQYGLNKRTETNKSESLKLISLEFKFTDGIMGDENADFGELYGQLMAMKEHAASLPTNERRLVAEQVVTAFWKAMGGDLLEIED